MSDKFNQKNYKDALEQARNELVYAKNQSSHWYLQVIRLQNLVKALESRAERVKIGDQLRFHSELTETIEALVNQTAEPMSPTQVRDDLVFLGFDIARYANPLAMIHQTLKRLADNHRIHSLGEGRYTRTALYDALLKASWNDVYMNGMRGNEKPK